jgi:hypothetical protein
LKSKQQKHLQILHFAIAFDAEFCLLLRERRSTTLEDMQEDAIDVESNILATKKLRSKHAKEKRNKKIDVASPSHVPKVDPKLDEMTKEFLKL